MAKKDVFVLPLEAAKAIREWSYNSLKAFEHEQLMKLIGAGQAGSFDVPDENPPASGTVAPPVRASKSKTIPMPAGAKATAKK